MAFGSNNKHNLQNIEFFQLHKIQEITFGNSKRDSFIIIYESKPIKHNANHTN
jgi:hypothetical protein